MADTSLILHVKGTESETAVLPKAVVRAGISEGKITHSQLIWIPGEHTWRPVKELPDLLPSVRVAEPSSEQPSTQPVEQPVERLILHVKGTEAETRELPKQAIRTAVSKGEITHSQLIWIPNENQWKPVRELPDLMPGETLILHVKGTESQTQELPKKAVQTAVSKGEITHSQLIWIPSENSWKPVRELPDLLPGERLILHVKGTESQTTELPKRAIRTALAKGEITHSQLIWSPHEHAWKQVRDLPELLPSQKLAPAPARETAHPVPRVAEGIIPESPTGPVARAMASDTATPQVRVATVSGSTPRVRVATASGSTPTPRVRVATAAPPKVSVLTEATVAKVRVAESAPADVAEPVVARPAIVQPAAAVPVATPVASTPQVRVAAAAGTTVRAATPFKVQKPVSHKVEEEDHAHPLKWICIGLGIAIILLVLGNFFLIDVPLTSNLKDSTFPNVKVYAHLGAFMQPSVLVIHIPASQVTPDNLTDFLVALAHATPDSPLTRDVYARVALTSGWTAQYSFSGYGWKQIGDMQNESADQRKETILDSLGDGSGESLMPESTLNQEAQQAKRDMVWGAFVAHFTGNR